MAEETNKSTKKVKPEQTKSPLTGAQTKATTLDSTTKLDIDTQKALIDMLIDAGTNSSFDYAALTNFTTISNNRDQIYQLIDTMMQDSSVSSVVRTFAEDATEVADNGHIMWCESSDPKISKFINYLLNVMNVDKNIYGWAYSLVTYGDVYLKLYRESDYEDPLFNKNNIETTYAARNVLNEDYKKELDESINISMHKISDPYSYYVEMVPNPGTMFELTKYGRTYGYVETPDMDLLNTFDYSTITNMAGATNNLVNNYRMKSSDVNVYQADDYVHAFLADSESRYPEKVNLFYNEEDYKAGTNVHAFKVKRGKSMLYDSYKIWREKSLLESAILLTRLTRSSLIRKVQVEVGDMPKEQVKLTLRRVKELMEQKTALNTDQSMSEYTDPGAVINNIYFPTHNGQGAISVESIGGDYNPKELVDLDDWTNKFYSSYGIPKQYFGWCLGKDTELILLDGTTHTIEELYNNKANYIGKGIMGCNKDGSLCPTKISNVILTNEHAPLLRIWLDNGKYVDVTPDHRMMLRDGTFVEAQNLTEGDSLMPYYDKIKNNRRYVLDNKLGHFVAQYQTVSAKNGEPVEVGYNIHHKDKNKLNDDFDNLIKLSVEDHCKIHNYDLATLHKLANEKRIASGETVNANVGGKYITNGVYYTTLKSGEELPDGFWFEGPAKSDETKSKMRAARLQVLADHPEYKNLGGFKAGEASEETINHMKAGQAAYWANMTDEERSARRELSRANGKASIGAMQAARMAKLQAEKPDAVRTPRKLRCPVCDSIFELNLNNSEYANYLQLNKLYFCCPEHRVALDAGGKLARSYALYLKSNCDESEYEKNRLSGEARPDTFLKYNTLQTRLDTLNTYVPEVNHKVVKIEKLSTDNVVYDITVEDDCHTFALANGIFVHNCDDGAGFNGGTSLTILSSVYAKGVKRVQNALIQMITDAVSLFLINRGYKSYLNNFTLKMKAPLTQEEKDYREALSNKVNAVSNIQALFSDVESKERKLRIAKTLVSQLDYGDELGAIIQEEIDAAIAAEKQAEEEEAAAQAEENNTDNTDKESEDISLDDLDLGNSGDAPLESFSHEDNLDILTEDGANVIVEEDELPSAADIDIDLSRND